MKYLVFADRAEARKMQRALMRLMQLPKKGEHVGGGRHVAMPDAPNDSNARSIKGYTTRHVDFVRHPSNDGRFAVRVTRKLRDAWRDHKDRLTDAQRSWVQSRLVGEADLDDGWKTDDGEGNFEVHESEEVRPE